jgi:hypothetical protein
MNSIGGIRIIHTPQKGRTLHEHNQIKIKFPNGYTASIIYGALAYSADENGKRITGPLGDNEYASTVEIQITKPNGDPVPFKDGQEVKGFVPITELFQILNWVSTQN